MSEVCSAVLAVTAALGILTGCGPAVGPMQTEEIHVPAPDDTDREWDMEIVAGEARVTLDSRGRSLLQGTFAYNTPALKPDVTVGDHRVSIVQIPIGITPRRARSEWDLQLSGGAPLNLSIASGASRDEWELGGLRLRRLVWLQGSQRTRVTFSEPNLEQLEQFDIIAGSSALTLRGLANANMELANVNGGIGAITLVFDGQLTQDVRVVLRGAACFVTLHSGGNPVRLDPEIPLDPYNHGWTALDGAYYSPEWTAAAGPKVIVESWLGLSVVRLFPGTGADR